MTESSSVDRRQFARTLLAISGIAAVTPISDNSADDKTPAAANGAGKPNEPDERPTEEFLLLNCLLQRYPSEKFDEAAVRGIYRDLRGDVARGRILSAFPLKNSDEPSFVFRVYRAAE